MAKANWQLQAQVDRLKEFLGWTKGEIREVEKNKWTIVTSDEKTGAKGVPMIHLQMWIDGAAQVIGTALKRVQEAEKGALKDIDAETLAKALAPRLAEADEDVRRTVTDTLWGDLAPTDAQVKETARSYDIELAEDTGEGLERSELFILSNRVAFATSPRERDAALSDLRHYLRSNHNRVDAYCLSLAA